ncbi:MAG: nucleotide exchange factor GrpE [Clostridia bacterium]|nr:nucleotide exchange factor GrpE [Clostridia bacterium]
MEEEKRDLITEDENTEVQPEAENNTEEPVNTELAQLQEQLTQTQDQYQRVLAEYANYKRRTDQEKEQLGSFVKAEVLKALLPVIDNLERAVESPENGEYKKGVEMVVRQFGETLGTLGLEEIPALNQVFDPERHNAVMREDADGVEPETVTEVYQKGYALGARVLRPAMVKVAN